jgi:hypothetical protein
MAGQIKKQGYNQADLVDFLRALRNRVLSHGTLPNLSVGSVGVGKARINTAMQAVFDGVPTAIAAQDNADIFAPFAASVLIAGQGAAFRIEITAAGVMSAKMGQIVPAGAGDKLVTYLPMPIRTPGLVTLGYMLVQGAFTPGTTTTAGLYTDGDPDLRPGINLAGYGTVGLES